MKHARLTQAYVTRKIVVQGHCAVAGDDDVPEGEKCQAIVKR